MLLHSKSTWCYTIHWWIGSWGWILVGTGMWPVDTCLIKMTHILGVSLYFFLCWSYFLTISPISAPSSLNNLTDSLFSSWTVVFLISPHAALSFYNPFYTLAPELFFPKVKSDHVPPVLVCNGFLLTTGKSSNHQVVIMIV